MALLCGVLFCGCKKDKEENKYPSYETVAQLIPGVWECVDSYVPEDEGSILEFVSRGQSGGGTCYINGTPYDWELEPVYKSDFTDNVTGCALSLTIGGSLNWFFVYSINGSKMEWRNIGRNWNASIGTETILFEKRPSDS